MGQPDCHAKRLWFEWLFLKRPYREQRTVATVHLIIYYFRPNRYWSTSVRISQGCVESTAPRTVARGVRLDYRLKLVECIKNSSASTTGFRKRRFRLSQIFDLLNTVPVGEARHNTNF